MNLTQEQIKQTELLLAALQIVAENANDVANYAGDSGLKNRLHNIRINSDMVLGTFWKHISKDEQAELLFQDTVRKIEQNVL